jgi:putative transposase
VRTTFGDAALVQRCQVHKTRNILEHLSDRDRPWAQAILRRAYQAADVKTAQRLLLDLARRLETSIGRIASSR